MQRKRPFGAVPWQSARAAKLPLARNFRLIAIAHQGLLCEIEVGKSGWKRTAPLPATTERIGWTKGAACSHAVMPQRRAHVQQSDLRARRVVQDMRDLHGIHPVSSPSSNLINRPCLDVMSK